MEKEALRNRNITDNTQLTPKTTANEITRNSKGTSLGKRKKRRENRKNYLQDWLDKALQQDVVENDSDFGENICVPNYYPIGASPQQRIYPAMSDPSFCRFSVPVNPVAIQYPLESLSLPFYNHSNNKSNQHIPQPNYNIPRNMFPLRQHNLNNRTCHLPQDTAIAKPTCTPVSPDLQFTSLPLGEINAPSVDDSQDQRRFSDPGLGSNGEAQNSSDSEDSNGSMHMETVPRKIITTLVEQISSLKEITAKLSKDVFDMRGELEQLKQQTLLMSRRDIAGNTIAPVSPLQSGVSSQGYTPGMLADAIREVRDSTKVREEAFMLRFKSMLDERTINNLYSGINGVDSVSDSGRDVHDITRARINKLETECRLERLEEDLRAIRLHNEAPYSPQNGIFRKDQSRHRSFDNNKLTESEREREMEMEILDLRREVQEAKAGREEAIEKSRSHERLVTILRKKLHNMSNGEDASPDRNPTTRHSSISLGGNSNGPAHHLLSPVTTSNQNGYVTMSGPVTDL